MEERIRLLEEIAKKMLVVLKDFSAEFKNLYTNNVKVAEASHINYTNLIMASKEELEKLEKQKEDVVNSSLKLVEDAKLKMKTEKENFSKIMKQEQDRLNAEYAKFDKLSKDYSFMEKETIQLNQESKAANVKAKEDSVKVEALKEELEYKVEKYDNLLSSVSQQKVQQDNAQKKIDASLIDTGKAEKDISEQQQGLVKTSNVQVAKEKDLAIREESLLNEQNKLNKEKVRIEKLQNDLVIQQENLDKEKEVVTKDRSNLAAKESNLKQLEKELLEQKK